MEHTKNGTRSTKLSWILISHSHFDHPPINCVKCTLLRWPLSHGIHIYAAFLGDTMDVLHRLQNMIGARNESLAERILLIVRCKSIHSENGIEQAAFLNTGNCLTFPYIKWLKEKGIGNKSREIIFAIWFLAHMSLHDANDDIGFIGLFLSLSHVSWEIQIHIKERNCTAEPRIEIEAMV